MSPTQYNILILANSATDAELYELQLHKAMVPFVPRTAASKELFLKAMEDFRPDVIIADLSVARMDVIGAMSASRTEYPDAVWIVIASSGSEETAVAAMKGGASDYLPKKNIARLGQAVKVLLQKKGAAAESHGPPAAAQKDRLDENFFREIVEQASDLVAVLDLDGRRIYNNPAYKAVLEDPAALKGTDSFLDVHPDDRETVKHVFHESLRSGTGKRLEYRLIGVDGNIRMIESQGSVIKDAQGKTARLSVVSRDITERRTTELSLQRVVAGTAAVSGDDFFQALVRHLAHALDVQYVLVSEIVPTRKDRVRAIAYWANEQWMPPFEYDVAGTTCERVILEGIMCYFPDHVQQLFPKENALVTMEAVCYLGLPLFRASGDLAGHLFVMDGHPLRDFAWVKFVMSLFAARAGMELERRQQVVSARRGEATYRGIVESLTDAVIVTDLSDIITYVNPRMAQLAGFTVPEMTGKLASTLLLPREQWEALQKRNRERRRGVVEQYETQMRRKDGTFFRARVHGGPCRDENGTVVGTLAIVTELPADGA